MHGLPRWCEVAQLRACPEHPCGSWTNDDTTPRRPVWGSSRCSPPCIGSQLVGYLAVDVVQNGNLIREERAASGFLTTAAAGQFSFLETLARGTAGFRRSAVRWCRWRFRALGRSRALLPNGSSRLGCPLRPEHDDGLATDFVGIGGDGLRQDLSVRCNRVYAIDVEPPADVLRMAVSSSEALFVKFWSTMTRLSVDDFRRRSLRTQTLENRSPPPARSAGAFPSTRSCRRAATAQSAGGAVEERDVPLDAVFEYLEIVLPGSVTYFCVASVTVTLSETMSTPALNDGCGGACEPPCGVAAGCCTGCALTPASPSVRCHPQARVRARRYLQARAHRVIGRCSRSVSRARATSGW